MSVGLLIDIGKSLTLIQSALISVDLDVMIDESHEWLNDVVTSPVEVDSPISDHIQPQPDKLTITGMISDSPISDSVISQLSTIGDSSFGTRTQTTFDLLRELMAARQLVTVYTRYRIYNDMALASINIPRSAGMGEAIQFTAQFTHVRLVEVQTVNVPAGISRKKDGKVGGRNSSVAHKTEEQVNGGKKDLSRVNESLAKTLFGTKSSSGFIEGVDVRNHPAFSIYK